MGESGVPAVSKDRRRPYRPIAGAIYENHGGGIFRCMGQIAKGPLGWEARFRNIKSGWEFEARGVHSYQDGRIDWDYSVHGRFVVKEAMLQ